MAFAFSFLLVLFFHAGNRFGSGRWWEAHLRPGPLNRPPSSNWVGPSGREFTDFDRGAVLECPVPFGA